MTATAPRIDVRAIPPRERHPLIFSTFQALATGQALELVNDHDPRPLYYQFNAQVPGEFSWDYLQNGPDLWRVAITRTGDAQGAAAGSCCGGGCGGA
ncbi:DUF2249 domain-containing protein [Ramlibacter sp. XY19]|uniref:DUF2249 domain-containing protein n=1 Tax=Ramlibacter paludis TaxID=2908000 RepID=UPI0023DC3455|nr:DUF2249 domain-containing protein [Ramlibacter paludis]MCG2595818.1 DUF2249 domain-containing protein [Ramlibacter paludis]